MTINYSLIDELMELPGVMAAGGFTYRGDQNTYRGLMSDVEADILAKAARATLEAVRMQGDILKMFTTVCSPGVGECGLEGGKGLAVRGTERTICVVSNAFCIFDHHKTSLNPVLSLMLERQADAPDVLI
ncbi:MAG: hypothetical protein B7Y40_04460 [Gammaproteobacteria bacterium 28-57-27]|nr:MAG: hypothetical protein B7Y40_04460 [Gammaproteobacteria bacterium 28-57-27]